MKTKLPEGWKIKKIKDFTEVITGGTPSTMKIEYWENGTVPWLPSGDLKNKPIKEAHIFITEEGLKNSAAKLMPKKTVVIALTGATTGQIGILELEASANQSVTGILPSKEHLPEYLFYYMRTAREKILNESYGAAQPHISQGYVKDFEVILPPLQSQQKIVSILEKAEKAKEMRKEADELTKEFLKSVFMEMFGDPIRNTKKWQLKKFEEVIRLRRGFDLPVQERAVGKYPLLASNGIIDSISEFKVTGPGIVTGRSGTIGKVNYVKENYWPLNTTLYSEDLHGNNPLYLLYFLQVYDLERFVRGTGVPTLNRNLFHNEMIIYPPLPLQNKFASIVKEVEQMKEQQKHSKEQIDNLFNVLMQKAFKGELVA